MEVINTMVSSECPLSDIGRVDRPMEDEDHDSPVTNLHFHTRPHIPTPSRKGIETSASKRDRLRVTTPSPIRRPNSTPTPDEISDIGYEWASPAALSCRQPQPRRHLPSPWNLAENLDDLDDKNKLSAAWISNIGDADPDEPRASPPLVVAATPDLDERAYTVSFDRFDRERFATVPSNRQDRVPMQAAQTPSPMYCSIPYRDYYPNGYDNMWSGYDTRNGRLDPYYQEVMSYGMVNQGYERNWWDAEARTGHPQQLAQHPGHPHARHPPHAQIHAQQPYGRDNPAHHGALVGHTPPIDVRGMPYQDYRALPDDREGMQAMHHGHRKHERVQGKKRDEDEPMDMDTPDIPDARDLQGEVVGMAKTQQGSKYLQRFLNEGTSEIVILILQEVEPALDTLMCDKYANYLCSVVFTACDHGFRKRMLEKIAPRLAEIACDQRGTHALQALIQVLGENKNEDPEKLTEEQIKFVQALNVDLPRVSKDPNGTHAIQKTIQCFQFPATSIIFTKVIENFMELANQPHGLCVLKVCITACHRDHRASLLHKLADNALDLVQSPYGNYAVQHILDEYGWKQCESVFESLESRYAQLSVQKFSSNVVEKILMLGPARFRKKLIDELVDADRMSVLVSSVYGQYVVKRALEVSDDSQVYNLVMAISAHLGQVSNRRLRSKWEKMIQHNDLVNVVQRVQWQQT